MRNAQIFVLKCLSKHPFRLRIHLFYSLLLEYEVKVFIQKSTFEEVERKSSRSYKSVADEYTADQENKIDLLVIIGGDGTIMYALKDFQNRVAPIVVAFSQV